MTTLKRLTVKAEYDPSKSYSDIDSYRNQKLDEFNSAGISGYFIVSEGEGWIVVEGEEGPIEDFERDLDSDGDGFFYPASIDKHDETISSPRLDYMYLYNEDRDPVSNKP